MSGGAADEPDLTTARAQVLALVAGSPMSRDAPAAQAATPIRPLPPEIEAKLAAGTRLKRRERRALETAKRWQSKQAWTGPAAYSQERGLVVAAARAVDRIAQSGPWRSGRPDQQFLQIDLATELDQIDDQAHRIAVARSSTTGAPTAEVIDTAWDVAVTRVAALTAFADELTSFDTRRLESRSRHGDVVADSTLLAGSASDEMALDRITALTSLLTAGIDDPLG